MGFEHRINLAHTPERRCGNGAGKGTVARRQRLQIIVPGQGSLQAVTPPENVTNALRCGFSGNLRRCQPRSRRAVTILTGPTFLIRPAIPIGPTAPAFPVLRSTF